MDNFLGLGVDDHNFVVRGVRHSEQAPVDGHATAAAGARAVVVFACGDFADRPLADVDDCDVALLLQGDEHLLAVGRDVDVARPSADVDHFLNARLVPR